MALIHLLILAGVLQLGCSQIPQDTCTCSDVVVLGKEEIRNEIRAECNNTAVTQKLDDLSAMLSDLSARLSKLTALHQHGQTFNNPATSCSEILNFDESTPSGYYWLKVSNGSFVRMFCDMTRTCKGVSGPWMKVAMLDMTDSNYQCPPGLRQINLGGKRLCGISTDEPTCSSVMFDTYGIEYSQVCGKIIGYQYSSPDAFWRPNPRIDESINYVDGVSLTHGCNPREHIWTFAAAVDEVHSTCPCTSPLKIEPAPQPPNYVGNDYFCDTGSRERWQNIFYADDPLWDGQGCGPTSTCCSFNNPPWFRKQLPSASRDDIEMRLCRDQARGDEDVPLEIIEIYVQ